MKLFRLLKMMFVLIFIFGWDFGLRLMWIFNLNIKLGEFRVRFGKRKKIVVIKIVMLDRYIKKMEWNIKWWL